MRGMDRMTMDAPMAVLTVKPSALPTKAPLAARKALGPGAGPGISATRQPSHAPAQCAR